MFPNETIFTGILERLEKTIAPRVEGYDYINKNTVSFTLGRTVS